MSSSEVETKTKGIVGLEGYQPPTFATLLARSSNVLHGQPEVAGRGHRDVRRFGHPVGVLLISLHVPNVRA